jgi:hypothetical protein
LVESLLINLFEYIINDNGVWMIDCFDPKRTIDSNTYFKVSQCSYLRKERVSFLLQPSSCIHSHL